MILKNMANKHVNYLIKYFGDQNEELDDEELGALEDEIDALDHFLDYQDIFDLAKISIKLGKPDILQILFDKFDFNNADLSKLNKEIQMYINENSDEEEDEIMHDIISDFKKIIKDYSKRPYHKKR